MIEFASIDNQMHACQYLVHPVAQYEKRSGIYSDEEIKSIKAAANTAHLFSKNMRDVLDDLPYKADVCTRLITNLTEQR
jgi:hypothetical protein